MNPIRQVRANIALEMSGAVETRIIAELPSGHLVSILPPETRNSVSLRQPTCLSSLYK